MKSQGKLSLIWFIDGAYEEAKSYENDKNDKL